MLDAQRVRFFLRPGGERHGQKTELLLYFGI
jgi:hypothetical protein